MTAVTLVMLSVKFRINSVEFSGPDWAVLVRRPIISRRQEARRTDDRIVTGLGLRIYFCISLSEVSCFLALLK